MISDALKTHVGKALVLAEELSSTPAGPEHADDAIDTLRDALSAAQRLADYAARCGVDVRDQLDLDFIQIIPAMVAHDTRVLAEGFDADASVYEAFVVSQAYAGMKPDSFISLRGIDQKLSSGEITQEQAWWGRWQIHNALWHPLIRDKMGPQLRPFRPIETYADPRTGRIRYRLGAINPDIAICAELVPDLMNPPQTAFPDDESIIRALPEYMKAFAPPA